MLTSGPRTYAGGKTCASWYPTNQPNPHTVVTLDTDAQGKLLDGYDPDFKDDISKVRGGLRTVVRFGLERFRRVVYLHR